MIENRYFIKVQFLDFPVEIRRMTDSNSIMYSGLSFDDSLYNLTPITDQLHQHYNDIVGVFIKFLTLYDIWRLALTCKKYYKYYMESPRYAFATNSLEHCTFTLLMLLLSLQYQNVALFNL
jgi:hypothetical protein